MLLKAIRGWIIKTTRRRRARQGARELFRAGKTERAISVLLREYSLDEFHAVWPKVTRP